MASSAAARVFDVAELMESILLHVAHLEGALEPHINLTTHMDLITPITEFLNDPVPLERASDTWKITNKLGMAHACDTLRPITKLYVLKRVNRTFNLSITHSTKLARLMFLAPLSETESTILLNSPQTYPSDQNGADLHRGFVPVKWLNNFLYDKTDNVNRTKFSAWSERRGVPAQFSDRPWQVMDRASYSGGEDSRDHPSKIRADPDASWRAMRLSIISKVGPVCVVVRTDTRRWRSCLLLTEENFLSPPAPPAKEERSALFTLESSGTLGDFFDRFVEAHSYVHGFEDGVGGNDVKGEEYGTRT